MLWKNVGQSKGMKNDDKSQWNTMHTHRLQKNLWQWYVSDTI